jgi:hypothetical protein
MAVHLQRKICLECASDFALSVMKTFDVDLKAGQDCLQMVCKENKHRATGRYPLPTRRAEVRDKQRH